MEKTMINFVSNYLDGRLEFNSRKPADDTNLHWDCEFQADYNDWLGEEAIVQILEDDDPKVKFTNLIDECFYSETLDITEDILDDILLQKPFTGEQADEIRNFLDEHISWHVPYDHYLDQDVLVDICIDTGDRNYDYSLNTSLEDGKLDPHASLVWLAKEQGYSYDQLNASIKDVKVAKKDKFLESVHDELYNASGLGMLVFLVNMSLRHAIAIAAKVNKSHEDVRHEYEPYLKDDNGFIILDKDVTAGLFDEWNGGGSTLGLEFDKDVSIPIKYIAKAVPDASLTYSVSDVYGLCDSAWSNSLNSVWD